MKRLLPLIAFVLSATACRDATGVANLALAPSTRPTAQLVATSGAPGDSSVTVAVRIGGLGMLRVASITASITYDTTQLRFAGDASADDGAMRATHATRGRVALAVAHPVGLSGDSYAVLHFVAAVGADLHALSLAVTELHAHEGTNLRAKLIVLPTAVVR